MAQPVAIILSDNAEFSAKLVARWQMERAKPTLLTVDSLQWNECSSADCDVAVIGPVPELTRDSVLSALELLGTPVVVLSAGQQVQTIRARYPRVLVVREYEGYVENMVLLATEALKRAEATARACHAEHALAECQPLVQVGRFMLDTRHSINNALTSVLGNSELLLLEPDALTTEAREQIEIIHTMGLRMHEMMQRISSLAAEAKRADAQAGRSSTMYPAGCISTPASS